MKLSKNLLIANTFFILVSIAQLVFTTIICIEMPEKRDVSAVVGLPALVLFCVCAYNLFNHFKKS